MHKRELERQLLIWSKQQAEQSGYQDKNLQRIYQMGVILGLLSSVCERDFYARQQILKKIQQKN